MRTVFDRELAGELGRAAGISLKRFQRVASQRQTPQPVWSTAFSDRDIRRAWLLQAWTTARSGDVEAFETLVGKSFDDAEDPLRQATRGADPIFSTVGTVWSVVSPVDFWGHVKPYIGGSDLEALQHIIQDVLGAVDPALELPPDERWLAGMRGMVRIHSRELRRGLATTLTLIGTKGETATLGGASTGGAWVRGVLRSLFRRANADESGQLWASLTDVLPLLAEAAPDIFLSALGTAIAHPGTVLSQMFTDSHDDAFTTTSPHTGLVRALEVTAWLPAHFGQSVSALAALSEIDPGGRLSNRPFGSLKTIFRPWLPQTLAGPGDRLASLTALVERYPDTGLRLLIELLPSGHDLATPNAEPEFRAKVPRLERADPREWVETVTALVSQLLPLMRAQGELWPSFLAHLADLPQADRARVYAELPVSIAAIEPDERTALWEAATDLIRRHREHHDSRWPLPEDEIERFETAIADAAPNDPRDAARWLFDETHPDIGVRKAELAAYDAAVDKLRVDALRRILDEHGMSGIEEFVNSVKYPYLVGWALAGVGE